MVVKLCDDVAMSFGGTFDPAYLVNLYSIGKISAEDNLRTSAGLSGYLAKELGLRSDRGYITFHDVKASDWGFQGTTFGTIFK
jgi:phenylpyruvate tautomerase